MESSTAEFLIGRRLLRPIPNTADVAAQLAAAVILDADEQAGLYARQALLAVAEAKEEVYDYIGEWILFSGWAEQIEGTEMMEALARIFLLAGVPATHPPRSIGRGFRQGKALLSCACSFEGRREMVGRVIRFFASQRVIAADRVPPRVAARNREREAKGKTSKGQGKGGKGEKDGKKGNENELAAARGIVGAPPVVHPLLVELGGLSRRVYYK